MYRCVIDAESFYKTYVLFDGVSPLYYDLKDGETLIDTPAPVLKIDQKSDGFVRPLWDGDKWVEGACESEIDEFNRNNPTPDPEPEEPSQLDRVEAQATYTAMMTDTLLEG